MSVKKLLGAAAWKGVLLHFVSCSSGVPMHDSAKRFCAASVSAILISFKK